MGRHKSPEDLRSRTFPISAYQDSWIDEAAKERKVSRGEIIRLALNLLIKDTVSLEQAFPINTEDKDLRKKV